jgi:hypothetical protein
MAGYAAPCRAGVLCGAWQPLSAVPQTFQSAGQGGAEFGFAQVKALQYEALAPESPKDISAYLNPRL